MDFHAVNLQSLQPGSDDCTAARAFFARLKRRRAGPLSSPSRRERCAATKPLCLRAVVTWRIFMRSTRIVAAVAALGLSISLADRAGAASPPVPSATITQTSSGATNTYSLTLKDSAASPSPIGTFWFSWTPGQDYMNDLPTSVTSPVGWSDIITNGGSSDGYAIQWTTSSATVPAGASLSGFAFSSPDSLATLQGDSRFYPSTPALTSVSYSGSPFSDRGAQFIVTAASLPEPSTLALLTPAILVMMRRRRRIA
jgi:hypothetical protein